jgi:hypothetical protein
MSFKKRSKKSRQSGDASGQMSLSKSKSSLLNDAFEDEENGDLDFAAFASSHGNSNDVLGKRKMRQAPTAMTMLVEQGEGALAPSGHDRSYGEDELAALKQKQSHTSTSAEREITTELKLDGENVMLTGDDAEMAAESGIGVIGIAETGVGTEATSSSSLSTLDFLRAHVQEQQYRHLGDGNGDDFDLYASREGNSAYSYRSSHAVKAKTDIGAETSVVRTGAIDDILKLLTESIAESEASVSAEQRKINALRIELDQGMLSSSSTSSRSEAIKKARIEVVKTREFRIYCETIVKALDDFRTGLEVYLKKVINTRQYIIDVLTSVRHKQSQESSQLLNLNKHGIPKGAELDVENAKQRVLNELQQLKLSADMLRCDNLLRISNTNSNSNSNINTNNGTDITDENNHKDNHDDSYIIDIENISKHFLQFKYDLPSSYVAGFVELSLTDILEPLILLDISLIDLFDSSHEISDNGIVMDVKTTVNSNPTVETNTKAIANIDVQSEVIWLVNRPWHISLLNLCTSGPKETKLGNPLGHMFPPDCLLCVIIKRVLLPWFSRSLAYFDPFNRAHCRYSSRLLDALLTYYHIDKACSEVQEFLQHLKEQFIKHKEKTGLGGGGALAAHFGEFSKYYSPEVNILVSRMMG